MWPCEVFISSYFFFLTYFLPLLLLPSVFLLPSFLFLNSSGAFFSYLSDLMCISYTDGTLLSFGLGRVNSCFPRPNSQFSKHPYPHWTEICTTPCRRFPVVVNGVELRWPEPHNQSKSINKSGTPTHCWHRCRPERENSRCSYQLWEGQWVFLRSLFETNPH